MTIQTLINWPDHGWAVIGDPDGDSYLALTKNSSEFASEHAWHLSAIEDDHEREAEFAELLGILQNAEIFDTEYLNAIVVNITDDFDWYDEGTSRALYTLKSEDKGTTYVAASDDHAHLVDLVKTYTDEATE